MRHPLNTQETRKTSDKKGGTPKKYKGLKRCPMKKRGTPENARGSKDLQ
jgi:hypothetical protein